MKNPQNSGAGQSTGTAHMPGNGIAGPISPTAALPKRAENSLQPSAPNSNEPIPARDAAITIPAQRGSVSQKPQMTQPEFQAWNEILWQSAVNAKDAGAPVEFAEVVVDGEWQVVYVFRGARICRACRYPYLGDKCERTHVTNTTKATT